jgi:uncharacterized protein
MTPAQPTVTHNTDKRQFELRIDDTLSIVTYFKPDEQTLALAHTEVDPALEGRGVGSSLVKQVLEYAEAHDLKIVPLCPFVDAYIKRHPDWKRVVSTTHSISDF